VKKVMTSKDSVQDIRISLYPPASERSPALLELVASGRGSLDFALGDAERRVRLLSHGLDWSRVVVAWRHGQPVGYAQMRFSGCGPYQPGWRVFLTEYGRLRGAWAGLVFHVAELWNWRSPFYFYGLKVLPQERCQGIGEALVSAVLEHASLCGYDSVELDVGPNFEIAKRLYERCGFAEVRYSRLWGITRFLPFRGLCFMRCKVPAR
jgi:ribosomal protein S18 acetylase RimI-like enzyme